MRIGIDDNACVNFVDEDELLDTLRGTEADTVTTELNLNSVNIKDISGLPIEVYDIISKYDTSKTCEEAIASTMETETSSGIGLTTHSMDGKDILYPLSSSAYADLISKLGASCSGLYGVPLNVQVEILQKIMDNNPSMKKNVQLKLSEGKIRAILSENYRDISSHEAIVAIGKYLDANFRSSSFEGASLSHDYMKSEWQLNDEKLEDAYKEKLAALMPELSDGNIVMEFENSMTGHHTARLVTRIVAHNISMKIGNSLAYRHSGETSMEKFEESLEESFARIYSTMEVIANLSKVKIDFPVDCLINISNSLKLSKKALAAALPIYRGTVGTEGTALNVWYGLQLILNETKKMTKLNAMGFSNLEETVFKVLVPSFKWSTYDEPIEVTPEEE